MNTSPFVVAVDREKLAIVIAVRGTLSMEDVVTDGLAGNWCSGSVWACCLALHLSDSCWFSGTRWRGGSPFLVVICHFCWLAEPVNIAGSRFFNPSALDAAVDASDAWVHGGFWKSALAIYAVLKYGIVIV